MTSPILEEPSLAVEVTFVTVGTVVSIIKALLALREFVCPTAGRVKVEGFPTRSLMVPLLSPRAVVPV